MPATASRLGRLFGPALMLFLLQLLALLALGLEAGYFHHRVALLLEPLSTACGGADPVARLQVAEQLMARAEALDDWQPLRWIPLMGIVLALLGAMTLCTRRALRMPQRWRAAGGSLALLHGAALALASWTLHLYENAWSSLASLSPATCLVDLTEHGKVPLAQAQQVVFHILTREHAPLQRNPDDLALVLATLLLMAMAASLALWRAAARGGASADG